MSPLAPDLEAFLRYLERRDDPAGRRTVKSYQSKLRQFLAWLGEREITAAVLVEWRDHLRFDALNRRGGQGQKPRTIKHAFTALTQWLQFLEDELGREGLPDPRKIKKPRVIKSDHGDSHVPLAEEVQALFEAAAALPGFTVPERFERARAQAILSLAIDLGLRRGEILALGADDLETHRDPWQVVVRKGKGDQFREVPCSARARELLAAYLEACAAWRSEVPARAQNPALFPRDRTRRLNADSIDRLRQRLLAAAGLSGKRIRLHDARHYRITAWLGVNGVNPATVAELAGHSDLNTTWGYASPVESEKALAVQRSEGGKPPPPPRRQGRRLARGGPGGARAR